MAPWTHTDLKRFGSLSRKPISTSTNDLSTNNVIIQVEPFSMCNITYFFLFLLNFFSIRCFYYHLLAWRPQCLGLLLTVIKTPNQSINLICVIPLICPSWQTDKK